MSGEWHYLDDIENEDGTIGADLWFENGRIYDAPPEEGGDEVEIVDEAMERFRAAQRTLEAPKLIPSPYAGGEGATVMDAEQRRAEVARVAELDAERRRDERREEIEDGEF